MQREPSSSAFEHLYQAVLLLASEVGRVEDRLALVYAKHIQPVDADALPLDARARFQQIREALADLYPAPGLVDGVDHDAAVSLAMDFLVFYDDLSRRLDLK